MPKLIYYRSKDGISHRIEEMSREQLIEALTEVSMQLKSLHEHQSAIDRARFKSLLATRAASC